MRDHLDELTKRIRSAIGRLIGNPQDLDGRVGLTPTRTMHETQRASRPSAGRFREAVGQMTLHERLAAQAEADRRYDKANLND
jgi:hypothetical protein